MQQIIGVYISCFSPKLAASRFLMSCRKVQKVVIVFSASGGEREERLSSSLIRVDSRARVWFTGPTAEERSAESSVGRSAMMRHGGVSRKQGLCFRKESMVLLIVTL